MSDDAMQAKCNLFLICCRLLTFQPFYLKCCDASFLLAEPLVHLHHLRSSYLQPFLRAHSGLFHSRFFKLPILKNSQLPIRKHRLRTQSKDCAKMEKDFSMSKWHGRSIQFIDIAVNLTDLMFQGVYRSHKKHDCDIERVLSRAAAAGVKKIIVVGGNVDESRAAILLCRTYSTMHGLSLFATVGVHPTRCDEFENSKNKEPSEYLQKLRELIANNRDVVVAIGELGLDFDRTEFCATQTQLKYFQLQLQLVAEFKLPMLLHMRAALEPFCDILKRNLMTWKDGGGVVHSFTGSYADSRRLLELDLSIGINGCSLKTPENLQVVQSIPMDRLLLETGH